MAIPYQVSPTNTLGEKDFYAELTRRNQHFVTSETQQRLSHLKVLIAGCGSTGGACIESLARLGIQHFALADNGSYELNNLNRQHALLGNLGENKAEFHASQVKGINPYCEVIVHPHGITADNVVQLVSWADIVMDGVDVTSSGGIAAKLLLHEASKKYFKPILTALDIGFCQWGKTYDYRDPAVKILDGHLEAARRAKHPLKALFSIVPVSAVPPHSLQLVLDIFEDSECPASQMGCTSDLLSGVIVPAMIRFAENGELVSGWNINVEGLAIPPAKRLKMYLDGFAKRRQFKKYLKTTA